MSSIIKAEPGYYVFTLKEMGSDEVVLKLHPNKGGHPELFKKFKNLYTKKSA